MKKIYVLLVSILALSQVNAQKEWVKFSPDERVSVLTPGTLTKMDIPNVDVYQIAVDSTSYSVTIVNFENFGMDSSMVQGMVNTESFQEQFKAGFTQQLGDAEIVSEKVDKLGDFTTYLYEVNYKDRETGSQIKMYVYSVFIGSKVYSFTYGSVTPVDSDKERFFKSIQVI